MRVRFTSFGDAPILSQGDSGTAVQILQNDLIALGYGPLTVDGQFGPATETALLKFQNDSSLNASGQVDQPTWDAFSATPLNLSTPSSNDPLGTMITNAGAQSKSGGPAPSVVPVSSTSQATAAPASSNPLTSIFASISTDWKLYAAAGALTLGAIVIVFSLVRRK